MDSLTQIVLGASMGELALGKKLGNRAMVWGAIAGTIPDLDVFSSWVADALTSLAFHRNVTHSIFYIVLASPIFAWVLYGLYGKKGKPSSHFFTKYFLPSFIGIYAVLVIGSFLSPSLLRNIWSYSLIITFFSFIIPLLVWLYRQWRPRELEVEISYSSWLLLFILGIGTHPLLDCFTTYGTQIFQPFSDLRVAWDTISVVDPIYTLPFLICLLVASRYFKKSKSRKNWVNVGLILSSAYLAFAGFHHDHIESKVEESLNQNNIHFDRYMVAPAIFQNILWSVTIDQGDSILLGRISALDTPFEFDVNRLVVFPKNDYLLKGLQDQRAVKTIKWFSNQYYSVMPYDKDTLAMVDLRFGLLPGAGADPVFKFLIFPQKGTSEYGVKRRRSNTNFDTSTLFSTLWRRIKGEKIEPLTTIRNKG